MDATNRTDLRESRALKKRIDAFEVPVGGRAPTPRRSQWRLPARSRQIGGRAGRVAEVARL